MAVVDRLDLEVNLDLRRADRQVDGLADRAAGKVGAGAGEGAGAAAGGAAIGAAGGLGSEARGIESLGGRGGRLGKFFGKGFGPTALAAGMMALPAIAGMFDTKQTMGTRIAAFAPTAGALAGGVVGSFFGPVGTMLGSAIGGALGYAFQNLLGKGLDALFGSKTGSGNLSGVLGTIEQATMPGGEIDRAYNNPASGRPFTSSVYPGPAYPAPAITDEHPRGADMLPLPTIEKSTATPFRERVMKSEEIDLLDQILTELGNIKTALTIRAIGATS